MSNNKRNFHLLYGAALLLMGIAMLFQIPKKIPQIMQIEYFASNPGFVYFCSYMIAVLLIGGGLKKIYHNYQDRDKTNNE